ncbi:MAG: hypothetical protein U9N56_03860, partial [Actinomycetota bacterium]|nr:hypothetical protein [Actinomycetota bacterium]
EKAPRQKREKTSRRKGVEPGETDVSARTEPRTAGSQMEVREATESEASKSAAARFVDSIDGRLEAAEKKWGALLPQWIFTRIMVGVVFVALILALIFPGVISIFLLAAGLLMVMLGAVLYTDPMLGTRWLPGRMGPMHVLLFGVTILLLGVLLGIIAN